MFAVLWFREEMRSGGANIAILTINKMQNFSFISHHHLLSGLFEILSKAFEIDEQYKIWQGKQFQKFPNKIYPSSAILVTVSNSMNLVTL